MRLKFAMAAVLAPLVCAQPPAYLNPDLPAEQRAADLVSRMTLEEKVLQMQDGFGGRNSGAPEIPRLNLAAYDFWKQHA